MTFFGQKKGTVAEVLGECQHNQQRPSWIMKTEPVSYSIQDLKRERFTLWDGVRNYQARNLMRDEMQLDDTVYIYHSITGVGIVGRAKVSQVQVSDPTALDSKSPYYDPKAHIKNPWITVGLSFLDICLKPLFLSQMRSIPDLSDMLVLRKGQRLSVLPVRPFEADINDKLCYPKGDAI